MRIFESCVETINEVTRDIFSRGQIVFDPTVQGKKIDREYESMEILGYDYTILSGYDKEKMLDWARQTFKKPHLTSEYGDAWFKDMISKPQNPPPSWTYFREYWKRFGIEENEKFSYTYSERMQNLLLLIKSLKENPSRRGAVITIYEDSIDCQNWGKKRVPCTLSYHFLIRGNLKLFCMQRSCDLINFFALDVYRALRLQEYVAEKLDVKVGEFVHFISSLHAYRCDVPEDRRW